MCILILTLKEDKPQHSFKKDHLHEEGVNRVEDVETEARLLLDIL